MSADRSLQILLSMSWGGSRWALSPPSIAYHLLEADAEGGAPAGPCDFAGEGRSIFCSRCFNYATAGRVLHLPGPTRDTTRICVVGELRDVRLIERTGSFTTACTTYWAASSVPWTRLVLEQLHIRELLEMLGRGHPRGHHRHQPHY